MQIYPVALMLVWVLCALSLRVWAFEQPAKTQHNDLPANFVEQAATNLAIQNQSPRPVTTLNIRYPDNLANFGNRGYVIAETKLTKQGNVESITVLDSAHPDMEQAAVQRILNYSFWPARRDWQNVDAVVSIRVNFDQPDLLNQGIDPFKMPPASRQLPEDLQYDVAPQIKLAAPVVYPLQLLKAGKTGTAKVYVLIDNEGRVRQADILSASAPEFGLAAKAAFRSWQFYPAQKNGKSSWSVITKEQTFSRINRDTRPSPAALKVLTSIKSNNNKSIPIYQLSELDRVISARYAPLPQYPVGMLSIGPSSVLLEFYVDQQGMVLLPEIIQADNDELAWLAVTALKRWQFDIPLHAGKPVIAKLRLPINFD